MAIQLEFLLASVLVFVWMTSCVYAAASAVNILFRVIKRSRSIPTGVVMQFIISCTVSFGTPLIGFYITR